MVTVRTSPCIVCGCMTVRVKGYHEICPVCGWQDDGGDYRDPDRYVGGPNHVTLREARQNYAKFGASELRLIERVRGPRPEEIPSPQDEAPGRQSWLESVDNPEILLEIYGEQFVPELDGVFVHEVRWHWDGPSFFIRFDLPTYPADPPDEWRKSGFNTVQVELALLGAESALEAQRNSNSAGSITLCVGPAMPVHLSLEAGRFRARVNADRAVIHELTAYTRSSPDEILAP